MADWQNWESAWHAALYGDSGFYRKPEGPAGHFRTAVHAAPRELAAAVLHLAAEHGCEAIVDVGAGRGELVRALAGQHSGLHLRLLGVDVVPRPVDLPGDIGWAEGIAAIPDNAFDRALVIGWELLDVVPCTVVELDTDGIPREVLVDPASGRERLADPVDDPWVRTWWPADDLEQGDRIEIGTARDQLWADLNRRAAAAGARLTLAVDYSHTRETRPAAGSLTGFRRGRAVPPRPDGSMDITAHVAIDAVAAAVTGTPSITTQHLALRGLGVTHPELLDGGGLGGFAWLTTVLSQG